MSPSVMPPITVAALREVIKDAPDYIPVVVVVDGQWAPARTASTLDVEYKVGPGQPTQRTVKELVIGD